MNFRARQGSTAERGPVAKAGEMYRQVCARIRVGVWGQAGGPLVADRGNSSIRLGSYFGRRCLPALREAVSTLGIMQSRWPSIASHINMICAKKLLRSCLLFPCLTVTQAHGVTHVLPQ
jgi:hypothetical protein